MWLFFIAFLAQAPVPTAADAVARINAKLGVVSVAIQSETSLAGRYTSAPAELTKRLGGVLPGGNDLYLFPDGSYIYTEWDDLLPPTIYDKGKWILRGGFLDLASDPDVIWQPNVERRHLLIRRLGHEEEVMSVGAKKALHNFEKNAGNDPGFMLLRIGRVREERFNKGFAEVKARLMREAWDPWFFRKGGQ
jgi:hypothetical protein